MNWSVRFAPLAVPEPYTVPPFGEDVNDQSTEVTLSPGDSHTSDATPFATSYTFWDFISLTPESMHMVMWIMSDRTLPRSLRMIEGFGIHSFRLINHSSESTFVKFHWRPKLGLQSTIWDEA